MKLRFASSTLAKHSFMPVAITVRAALRRLYALDGIVCSRLSVPGAVNDTEGPGTEHCLKSKGSIIDGLTEKVGCKFRV